MEHGTLERKAARQYGVRLGDGLLNLNLGGLVMKGGAWDSSGVVLPQHTLSESALGVSFSLLAQLQS